MIFSEFEIQMFNEWYFLFLILSAGAIVGLYFALRKASARVQFIVLFSLLALGFLLHFVKMFIPPYADYTDGFHITERGWRDSWFVNICGANIALFMFFFLIISLFFQGLELADSSSWESKGIQVTRIQI